MDSYDSSLHILNIFYMHIVCGLLKNYRQNVFHTLCILEYSTVYVFYIYYKYIYKDI